ncbi:MAG: B12-binding domain-containing radical SAM protein [Acidobacteria bacterium]|nr:B12-binding domain-containing radical SAM protein [Acidobacteriota bacterium]
MPMVLIGQSYYLRFDPKLWAAMQPYPPLGAMYAASYLRARQYDVSLFDAMLAGSEEDWARALDRCKPRFAVIYEDNFNYLSKMCLLRMRQAAYAMIDAARARGCRVIVCGSDATDCADRYLQRGAEFVLTGEGEQTLGELLDCLTGRSGAPLPSVLGLAYIDGESSRMARTPRRPDITDLDALPFPAWDLVDAERYRDLWRSRHGHYSMNMVTTRGCPYHCNWCAKPIWGQRYNVRSPENVAAELKWLKGQFGPDHISFADDIFGLKPGWLRRFASLVDRPDTRVPFRALGRADLVLRDGEVDALGAAGAESVWIGAESGSQRILDAMDKGIRVEWIREARRRLGDAGIRVGFFLQFGYPGETRDDIAATRRLVREALPDDIGISVSYPLPGTRFYERVRAELGMKQNWVDSSDLAMMYRGPFSTEFYRALHAAVHEDFRARKAWAELKRLARHPTRVGRRHIRTASTLARNLAARPLAEWRVRRLATRDDRTRPHEMVPAVVSATGAGGARV